MVDLSIQRSLLPMSEEHRGLTPLRILSQTNLLLLYSVSCQKNRRKPTSPRIL
jgi:hypothetical protein